MTDYQARRICPACGFFESAPGDRYCVDCGSATDRTEWIDGPAALDPTGRYIESGLHGSEGWCGETRPHTHGLSEGIITLTD